MTTGGLAATDRVERLKQRVIAEVDAKRDLLLDVSHRIHDNPELAFDERSASDLLASVLTTEGFHVERASWGLATAFVGRGGGGSGPNVALLCEYDALPRIGHACGHNIIAAAGLGAGLASAAVAGAAAGRVVVLGTPAEEGGGGKVLLAQRGALEGVDAAMMIHPSDADLTHPDTLACATLSVEYHGRAAHAAAYPEQGRNALDAAVLGYCGIAALRQHIESLDRVHGIFTEAGERPNIVPDRAAAEWYVRSTSPAKLAVLKERVLSCLEAGAAAAGCGTEHRATSPDYWDLRTNRALVGLYRINSERVGRRVEEPTEGRRNLLSTDMGNVSYVVPSIHPMVKVAPSGVSIHTEEFAQWAVSPEGDGAVLDAAKALAMTVVDLWTTPGAIDRVRAAFQGPLTSGTTVGRP